MVCMCICMYVETPVEARCVRFPWSCTCRQLWTARCGLEEEQTLLLSPFSRPLLQVWKQKCAWAWRMLKLSWQEFREPLHSSGLWLRGAVPSALLLFSTTAAFYPVRQNPRSATNFQSNLADALRRPGSHFWNCCVGSWCCVTEKNPGCCLWMKAPCSVDKHKWDMFFQIVKRACSAIPRRVARTTSDVMAWVSWDPQLNVTYVG